MRVEATISEAFTIFDAPGLDPITVVLQDFGTGVGRLIVECWGLAMSAYWGAMGSQRIAGFVATCDAGYVLSKLVNGRISKREEAYRLRIVQAVQHVLRDREARLAETPSSASVGVNTARPDQQEASGSGE